MKRNEQKTDDNQHLSFSIIIPVYNRSDEVEELLRSLTLQTYQTFEVVVVDDGSLLPCMKVVKRFADKLNISYYQKENTGPGLTRNYGCEKAAGNYYIFTDSDCTLPPHYMQKVATTLQKNYTDVYGGPDRVGEGFSFFQKAANYAMTSFWTTGGIRGRKGIAIEKFTPRSFNMGCAKAVFYDLKGFSSMPLGEDMDLTLRILRHGYCTQFITEAYVFHKRRTNIRLLFKQLRNYGAGRFTLFNTYPQQRSWIYVLPSLFTISVVGLIILSLCNSIIFFVPLVVYSLLIFVDASIKNKSLHVGWISIIATYTQFAGHGVGFMTSLLRWVFLKKDDNHRHLIH